MKLTFEPPQVPWNVDATSNAFKHASEDTAEEIATATQERGRADIAAAGNFGPAWQNALKSTPRLTPGGFEVKTTMRGRGWRNYQTGKTLRGKPLLWLPISGTDAVGVTPKQYPSLVLSTRKVDKMPFLISTLDHRPKYFGKRSIVIPKKFHLVEIAIELAQTIGARFTRNLKRYL